MYNLFQKKSQDSCQYRLFRVSSKNKNIIYILPWIEKEITIKEKDRIELNKLLLENKEFKSLKNETEKLNQLNVKAESISIKNGNINFNLSTDMVEKWLRGLIQLNLSNDESIIFDNEDPFA